MMRKFTWTAFVGIALIFSSCSHQTTEVTPGVAIPLSSECFELKADRNFIALSAQFEANVQISLLSCGGSPLSKDIQVVLSDIPTGITAAVVGSDVIRKGSSSGAVNFKVTATSLPPFGQYRVRATLAYPYHGPVAPTSFLIAPVSRQQTMAAGGFTGLGIRNDGRVVTWGGYYDNIPADATTDVLAVASGPLHNTVLKKNGSVISWGGITSPVPLEAKKDIVAIAAGQGYNLALTNMGKVIAWGF